VRACLQALGWLVLAAPAGATAASGVEEVVALEQAGQDEAALAKAEELSQKVPPSALPHLEAARLALKLGHDSAGVERHLEVARTLAPDNPRVRYLMALAKETQGNDAAARALYLEAIALRASYTEARSRLAALAIRTRDWALAEVQLRMLVALGERSFGRRLQLAHVLEEAGKSSQAETVLVTLHREQPNNAAVTTALADFYERHDRMKEAVALRHAAAAKKLRPLQPSRR